MSEYKRDNIVRSSSSGDIIISCDSSCVLDCRHGMSLGDANIAVKSSGFWGAKATATPPATGKVQTYRQLSTELFGLAFVKKGWNDGFLGNLAEVDD